MVTAMTTIEFCEGIRGRRIGVGLTQAQLARRIGVNIRTLQRWESLEALPHPLSLKAAQDVLRHCPACTVPSDVSHELIRAERRNRGMTQRELADAVGVTESTISYWEAGRHNPRPHARLRLLAALGCSCE